MFMRRVTGKPGMFRFEGFLAEYEFRYGASPALSRKAKPDVTVMKGKFFFFRGGDVVQRSETWIGAGEVYKRRGHLLELSPDMPIAYS